MATRRDRWLPALGKDCAKIDGRNFEQLLDFGMRLGALVNFYTTEDVPDGDWTEFFLADPTMLLAAILASDPDAAEQWAVRQDRDAVMLLNDLSMQLECWERAVQPGCDGSWTESLWLQLARILADEAAQNMRSTIRDNAAAQQPEWSEVARAGSMLAAQLRDLQQLARPFFLESLSRADHSPQIALYMAFCTLFEAAQKSVNGFSQRLIDFYYQDVLRCSPRPAEADRTFVTFAMADSEGVQSAPVPAGTLFPAGTDADGQDIAFASVSSLAVSPAQVEAIQALRVVKSALYRDLVTEGAHDHDHDHHHHHHHHEIEIPVAASSLVETRKEIGWVENPAASNMPVFGAIAPTESEGYTSAMARLGFAVSTRMLALAGGDRFLRLDLAATFDSAAEQALATLCERTGSGPAEILTGLVEKGFAFALSTDSGWAKCVADHVEVSALPDCTVSIHFKLPADFPPVTALPPDDEENAGQPHSADAKLPTLRAILRQAEIAVPARRGAIATYPFAVLNGMNIGKADLHVEVDGLPALDLSNSEGEIDPASPFPLFGGEPGKGAFLDIRSDEIFAKPITTLSVRIEWFELPPENTGFEGYYRYYVIDPAGDLLVPKYDNLSFTCAFDVVDPGWWSVEEDPPRQLYCSYSAQEAAGETELKPLCLAGHVEAAAPVCPTSFFGDLPISDAPPGARPDRRYDPSRSALRLTLAAPQYGYGAELYASNVMQAALAELPEGDQTREERCEEECADAGAPWVTLAQTLSDGLVAAKGKKGLAYYNAIFPSINQAVEILLKAYWDCRTGRPPSASHKVTDRIARQLGKFTRVQHKGALRNQAMRDSFETWQQQIESALRDDDETEAGCEAFVQASLAIDKAVVDTVCDGFADPQAHYPGNITPVIQDFVDRDIALVKQCCAECMKVKYPAVPFVPQASAIQISYTAAASTAVPADPGVAALAFAHILPFGGQTEVEFARQDGASLLPRYDMEGSLYFGFGAAASNRLQSLLIAMANPPGGRIANTLASVGWSVLQNSGWTPLTAAQIVQDGSQGLSQTGIVSLRLPNADLQSELMPPGRVWVRVAVDENAGAFPPLRSVLTNAVVAERTPQEDGIIAYAAPLAAGTITSAEDTLTDIETIFQPLPSFGGRPAEDQDALRIASGERLRHKNRAIDNWDYERIVLEQFPAIHGVKIVPAFNAPSGTGTPAEVESGGVLVVVLPSRDSEQIDDPTVPTASSAQLGVVEDYLARRASPFAAIMVANPAYERLQVSVQVRFAGDMDSGENIARLNRDLIAYLSPWDDQIAALRSQVYWQEAEISAFIASRPYVDAIGQLSIKAATPAPEGLRGWRFMTSATRHEIMPIPQAESCGAA